MHTTRQWKWDDVLQWHNKAAMILTLTHHNSHVHDEAKARVAEEEDVQVDVPEDLIVPVDNVALAAVARASPSVSHLDEVDAAVVVLQEEFQKEGTE
jgi:hypothetical protein